MRWLPYPLRSFLVAPHHAPEPFVCPSTEARNTRSGKLRWTSALLMAAIALAAVGGGAWWWKQRQDAAAGATAGGAATGPNAARRPAVGPGRFGGGNVQPVSVGTVQRAMYGWW